MTYFENISRYVLSFKCNTTFVAIVGRTTLLDAVQFSRMMLAKNPNVLVVLLVPERFSPYLRMHTNTKHSNNVEKMIRLIPKAPIPFFFVSSPSTAFSIVVLLVPGSGF